MGPGGGDPIWGVPMLGFFLGKGGSFKGRGPKWGEGHSNLGAFPNGGSWSAGGFQFGEGSCGFWVSCGLFLEGVYMGAGQ